MGNNPLGAHRRSSLLRRAPDGSRRGPVRNNREQASKARQAADAFFRPKRQTAEASTPSSAAPNEQSIRKPRILPAIRAELLRQKPADAGANRALLSRAAIPASHRGRIRAWLKYGMKISDVAQVYGVPIGELERFLRAA